MKDISELKYKLPSDISVSKKQQTRESKRNTIEYINLPVCFDLESYSFIEINDKGQEAKRAVMWAYGIGIDNDVYMGRTWESFVDALYVISDFYNLSDDRRIIMWVHNLGYDFQFFRKWLHWKQVFALDPRKVCYALTNIGIEFRCSYILTGYGLKKVGENLLKHDVRKLDGEIDYTEPRHPETVLTEKEIAYLENDCLVVNAHISEQIEIEEGIANIPLTKTGYVRRYVRRACWRDPSKPKRNDYTRKAYSDYMQSLTMDMFQYKSCKRAFQGGFTHANPCYVNTVMENVTSLDITSCYPAQILSNLYPVTPPQYVPHFDSKEDFINTCKKNCCIFTVKFQNLESVINYDHYISYSHCDIPKGTKYQLSNGRIVYAEELTTTITNVDFFIIQRCYKWEKYTISGFIKWGWGYLPKPIIESTLYMYEQKTTLKGVEGKEAEYQSLKEMLNSIYGMMVTDPLRPEIPYDLDTGEWGKEIDGIVQYKIALSELDKAAALERYNTDTNRFTYYPWGVFITAYARHMLWSAILEFKSDYIYSDTDSVKVINYEQHKQFIEDYNAYMEKKIANCLHYYGIDVNRAKPKNIKGEEKSLGTWDKEDLFPDTDITYKKFKTLGAKRYMVEGIKGLSITVSGINKYNAVPYIKKTCEENKQDVFDFFADQMLIPRGHCGKLIPYYGDTEIAGVVTDRDGKGYEYYEKSFVHMTEGAYKLTMNPDYVAYLKLLLRGFLN